MNSRISKIGNKPVFYNSEGQITQIGIEVIKYDSEDRMSMMGKKTVYHETINDITRIYAIGKDVAIYDENGLLIKLGDQDVSYGSPLLIPRSKPIPIPNSNNRTADVLTRRSSNYNPAFLCTPVKTTEPLLKEHNDKQPTFGNN